MAVVIGISCNQKKQSQELFVKADCIEAISRNDGLPIVLPIAVDLKLAKEYLAICHGIMLTGGGDITPSFYGEEECAFLEDPDYQPKRDLFEIELVKAAFNLKIPILAICRGMQVLNVSLGGDLHQDLNSVWHNPGLKQSSANGPLFHEVFFKDNTRLSAILGEHMEVNSYHHQGIKSLGEKLLVSGICPDGVVEGVETIEGPWIVGVQWHPERMPEKMEKLFQEFIHAAEIRKNCKW